MAQTVISVDTPSGQEGPGAPAVPEIPVQPKPKPRKGGTIDNPGDPGGSLHCGCYKTIVSVSLQE